MQVFMACIFLFYSFKIYVYNILQHSIGGVMTYRPLPDYLTIERSDIEGLGLFTTKDLSKGDVLGITHVEDKRFEDGYIRTPLGAFFNHSNNPNCEAFKFQDFIMLKTIRPIKAGEELTAYYWLYNLEENNERS